MPAMHPYQERAVQELTNLLGTPFEMTVALRGKTKTSVVHLGRYEAIDMGMGKTRIVLEYLTRTKKKAFIIAPIRPMIRTWPQEIKKWTPHLTYHVLHGKEKDNLFFKHDVDVKIINYDGLKWLANMCIAAGSKWLEDYVLVLDEATQIKNPSSTRFKVLQKLRPAFKLGIILLSGSPMPNEYKNLWSQYYMVDSGNALGRADYLYKQEYFFESGPPRWIVELKNGSAKRIQDKVAPLTTRLSAEDYLTLPRCENQNIEVDLPTEARKLYEEMRKESIVMLDGKPVTGLTAATTTMKLRQIAQGALYNEDRTSYTQIHEVKARALHDLVEESSGSPILCPISFRFELDILRRTFGYNIPAIIGGVSLREQNEILDSWDRQDLPLLLCHPSALSHGLNLQRGGRHVCWFGLTFDLEQYTQLNGRILRQGQTKSVLISHIIARGTIDEKIASVLNRKEATQADFLEAIKQELLY